MNVLRSLLLFFVLLLVAVPSAQAVTPLPGPGNTYDYVGAGFIHLNGTNKFLYIYLTSTGHGSDPNDKIVGRYFTCNSTSPNICPDGTWDAAPFDVYIDTANEESVTSVWQCTDVGCPYPNRIFVSVKRLSNGGPNAKDWGYVYSDDNGATWSSLQIQLTFSASTPDYRSFTLGGVPCRTSTPGKYFMGAGGANTGNTVYKVKPVVTYDYFQTWTQDAVEVYSGANQLIEPDCGYLGNNTQLMVMRDNGGGKIQISRSYDSGLTWSAPVASNMGGTGINVTGYLDDVAYGDVIIAIQDRTTTGISEYIVTTAAAAAIDVSGWPSPTVLDTGYTANGQHAIGRLDSNHIMLLWSKEISSSVANIVYQIVTLGTASQYIRLE